MDKFEYILNQFHRTHNKKRENYCIERIYNNLNNPNLKIVTQQMFRRDEKHIALSDLYFPQLKLSVEIDEEFHNNTADRDRARTEDVIAAMNRLESIVPFEPDEIRIDAGKNQTLDSINEQIDKVVQIIQQRIDACQELTWCTAEKTVREYIQQGIITANENASFRTIWDVSQLFAKGYKEGCRAPWFSARKGKSDTKIWCPKVSINVEGYRVRVPYNNEISLDSDTIFESAKNNNTDFVNRYLSEPYSKEIRYVFPYYKTETGEFAYIFKGVYALDIDETRRITKRVWKRINTELDISVFQNAE